MTPALALREPAEIDVTTPEPEEPPDGPCLSDEDLELLRLLATQLPADGIARRLDVSERTLRRRIADLCERLGVGGRIEAAVWAARRGLV